MAAAASLSSSVSSTFFSGAALIEVERGPDRVTCRREGIHPKFYKKAEVYCNGELVMTTGGTQPKYVVDVWSGNHPFYQGNETVFLQDANQVEKFNRRYGGDFGYSEIPVLTMGEIVFEKKKKQTGKGKGKR